MATDAVTITIVTTSGNHHNSYQTSDSDEMARSFLRQLIEAGHVVTTATHVSVSNGTDNLITDVTGTVAQRIDGSPGG